MLRFVKRAAGRRGVAGKRLLYVIFVWVILGLAALYILTPTRTTSSPSTWTCAESKGQSIADVMHQRGLGVRIWTPLEKEAQEGMPSPSGEPYVPESTHVSLHSEDSRNLRGAESWLWDNNEYSMQAYVNARVSSREGLTFAEEMEDADLCFPSCGQQGPGVGGRALNRQPDQHVVFEVVPGKEDKFNGCKVIKMYIELECGVEFSEDCLIVVPYIHGIFAPDHAALTGPQAPWLLNSEKHLLCFVGGVWRGIQRQRVFGELRAISDSSSWGADKYDSLFLSKFAFKDRAAEAEYWSTPEFYEDVWSHYSSSVFSWHPSGDTPTRRGFYDSLLLGCIPVVGQTSAYQYKVIFNGFLFDVPFENVVVVVSDVEIQDGKALMTRLQAIGPRELKERRLAVHRFAKYLQYGHRSGTDALTMGLGAALTWDNDLKKNMCDSGKVMDRGQMKEEYLAIKTAGGGNVEAFAPTKHEDGGVSMCNAPCDAIMPMYMDQSKSSFSKIKYMAKKAQEEAPTN